MNSHDIFTAVGLMLILSLMGAYFLWLGDRKQRRESQARAWKKENEWRLANPQFVELEELFGMIPKSLRELYENAELIQKGEFTFKGPYGDETEDHYVAWFDPADERTFKDWSVWNIEIPGKNFFPIANDGCGDGYLAVFTAEDVDDCPVYFWDHEGNGPGEAPYHKVADSLREFLRREISTE